MFGIGFSELVLVFLILIIFIRPEDLPKFLRSAGKLYGKARKLYKEIIMVKDKILKEIDEAASLDVEPVTEPKPAPKAKALPGPKPAEEAPKPAVSKPVPPPGKDTAQADEPSSLTAAPKE